MALFMTHSLVGMLVWSIKGSLEDLPSFRNPGFYPFCLGLIDALLQSRALAGTFWFAWTTADSAVGGVITLHFEKYDANFE